MDSHKSDREEINKNEGNVSPLRELVMLLTNFSESMSIVLELLLEYQFSIIKLVPITAFNPRWIINSMMILHENCRRMFHKDPNSLKILIYKYNSGEKVEEYVFSNNMTIYADVITICYLHHVINRRSFTHCKLVYRLMKLMKNKYHIIQTYKEMSLDRRMLTFHRIALSYPSISFDMACDKDSFSFIFFSEAFSHWNLPNVFCSPWLALIIPVLNSDYKTPLALLLAMAAILDHNKPCYLLYQRVVALYTSEVFSKCFKLELCKKWGIVYMTENEYNFAPYFTTARESAINVISSLKENDPNLQYVLSKI